MSSLALYQSTSLECSRKIAESYSTSFSSAIKLLDKDLRGPIYAIYGFVRLADEIVDTFHHHDQATLLTRFRKDTFDAVDTGISLNPVLHSFQDVVRKYRIETELVKAFFHSMEMDLAKTVYSDRSELNEYVYGSAEVVGLMCLKVFCDGDATQYDSLKPSARSLGAAFQKINFLRDLREDCDELGRSYFPGFSRASFGTSEKRDIELDIQSDLENALDGLLRLPARARPGVMVAYNYYRSLFRKIQSLPPKTILDRRVRVPNWVKAGILAKTGFQNLLYNLKA